MGRRRIDHVHRVRWATIYHLHFNEGLTYSRAKEEAATIFKSTVAAAKIDTLWDSYCNQARMLRGQKNLPALARKCFEERAAILNDRLHQLRYGNEKRHRPRKPRRDGKLTPPPYCVWVGNVLYCDLRVAGRHIRRSLFTKDIAIAAQKVVVLREQLIADAYFGGVGKPGPRAVDVSRRGQPPKACYWLRGSFWTQKVIRGRCWQRSLRTADPEIAAVRRDWVHAHLLAQYGPAGRPGPRRALKAG